MRVAGPRQLRVCLGLCRNQEGPCPDSETGGTEEMGCVEIRDLGGVAWGGTLSLNTIHLWWKFLGFYDRIWPRQETKALGRQ